MVEPEVKVEEVKPDTKKAAPKKSKFVVKTLADPEALCNVDTWISTQCLPLDWALGGRGLPVRRVIEAYGDNSTGKSLLGIGVCAETQRVGGVAGYADCEIAQYKPRVETLGVDVATLLYDNPHTVDEVFELLDEWIKYRDDKYGRATPLTFVWDSLAAIATMAELERSEKEGVEAKNYPDVPRALSVAYRQNIHKIAECNVLFFITNQTRQKLGMFISDGVATTGGEATKFYASVRIELQSRAKIKEGTRIIGANVQATVVKNRLAAPFKTILIPVYYAFGMDEAECSLNVLKDLGAVEVDGAWYHFKGEEKKFQKKQWTEIFLERAEEIATMLGEYK